MSAGLHGTRRVLIVILTLVVCVIIGGALGILGFLGDTPATPSTPLVNAPSHASSPGPPRQIIHLPSDGKAAPIGSDLWPPIESPGYLGALACRECHRERWETFVQTAHHRTSALATLENVAGSSQSGRNELQSGDPSLRFRIERRGDTLFQTAIVQTSDDLQSHTEAIDVVTGSGKTAQTYLYFRGSRLFQLPISYLRSADQWVTSPGMPDGSARFDRPVAGECLQCHATYFNPEVDPASRGTRHHILLGISCERCHGPGQNHVEYHQQHRDQRAAKHIVHPARLSRDRQMDLCGQCHSGIPQAMLQPPFAYKAGEPLDEYLYIDSQDQVGVHATNQAVRLSMSACFQQSKAMVCSTCHNPHVHERGNQALFSRRCQECHTSESCGMSKQLKHPIDDHCVECHMPLAQDMGTWFDLPSGDRHHPLMRDHAIGIYPETSKSIIEHLFQDPPGGTQVDP